MHYIHMPLDLLGNPSPFHVTIDFEVNRIEGRAEIEITHLAIFETVDGKSRHRSCPQWLSEYIEQDDYVIEECLRSLGTFGDRDEARADAMRERIAS